MGQMKAAARLDRIGLIYFVMSVLGGLFLFFQVGFSPIGESYLYSVIGDSFKANAADIVLSVGVVLQGAVVWAICSGLSSVVVDVAKIRAALMIDGDDASDEWAEGTEGNTTYPATHTS